MRMHRPVAGPWGLCSVTTRQTPLWWKETENSVGRGGELVGLGPPKACPSAVPPAPETQGEPAALPRLGPPHGPPGRRASRPPAWWPEVASPAPAEAGSRCSPIRGVANACQRGSGGRHSAHPEAVPQKCSCLGSTFPTGGLERPLTPRRGGCRPGPWSEWPVSSRAAPRRLLSWAPWSARGPEPTR